MRNPSSPCDDPDSASGIRYPIELYDMYRVQIRVGEVPLPIGVAIDAVGIISAYYITLWTSDLTTVDIRACYI